MYGEHLDARDAVLATQNCFKYLAPGGYIRVAVPDGFHPDENYINYVKPGGWGAGSEDHHVLYTYHTLKAVFASTGFDVTLLEYFDERGTFHYQEWSPADGMIMRSKRFDERNRTRELSYTSIILDAKKPAMIDRAGRGRNYTSTFPAQNSIIPQYTNTSFMVTITEKWRDLLARGSRFVALE